MQISTITGWPKSAYQLVITTVVKKEQKAKLEVRKISLV